MKLTMKNITQWKKQLDTEATPHVAGNYSECFSDETWIELYEGMTPREVILDEKVFKNLLRLKSFKMRRKEKLYWDV